MKKLKSAKKYFTDFWGEGNDGFEKYDILLLFKRIQLDAIQITAENCAEEAKLGNTENGIYNVMEVSKQSILNVADKMKGVLNETN